MVTEIGSRSLLENLQKKKDEQIGNENINKETEEEEEEEIPDEIEDIIQQLLEGLRDKVTIVTKEKILRKFIRIQL